MLRRIGRFFKDLTETIKRERGKLQIHSNPVDFDFKSESLTSSNEEVLIKESHTLQQMFFTKDLKNENSEVIIFGETDHSPSPGVSSATTIFNVELNEIDEKNSWYEPIKSLSYEFEGTLSLKKADINNFSGLKLNKSDLNKENMNQIDLKAATELNDLKLSVRNENLSSENALINNSQMKVLMSISNLETDFKQNQLLSFHFENSVMFNSLIEDYPLLPEINCNHSLACMMRYPIKRYRVSKSGYETEELKRALSFIVKRYESAGKLSIVGIYKNVPIDNAERLTFSKNKELYFYLKKGNHKRSVLMDVLVVKTKEGRYHVGPIIRKI